MPVAKTKKALIVANTGGFFSFLLNDIDILQKKGYAVQVAGNGLNHDWQDTKQALEQRNLSLIQVDIDGRQPLAKANWKAYRQIKELLKKEHYDLIHCHTPVVGLITRLAASGYRKSGTKVIYTTHGLAFTRYSSRKQRLMYHGIENFCSFLSDAIVTINREDHENVQKMHCKNVFYIPGVGVDLKKYHDVNIDMLTYRKRLGIDEDKIMVLSVGEISARKNHMVIVDAIGRIPNKENYVYAICGTGTDEKLLELLRHRAQELQVDLRLLGFRRDIPQIMHCSDIGAIPSVREGLGLAGIESLCAGVPLVGSYVQGISDYIKDGENGFLCHPFDAEGFAQKIMLLSQKDVRERMKQNCYSSVTMFDKEVSGKKMEEIYGRILTW